jgi:rubrerythrin
MAPKLGIEQAIEIAMEGERKAQAFYAQAALEVHDPAGRDLLGRLAAFEQHHYQKLAELARSLRQDGKFIAYQSRTLEQFSPVPSQGEAAGSLLEQLHDVAGILNAAIENEKLAEMRYRVLAEETNDADGQGMFKKLAAEESLHKRVLEDEFFSISNRGVWGWSGMYGE